jgi:sec-independent protein translocase protein TatA
MPDGLFANPLHWAILIVVVLIIFGPGKLPGVGSALGQSLREFRKASQTDPKQPATAASVATALELTQASHADTIACEACGASNPPEARHCSGCGASLEKNVVENTAAPVDAVASSPVCGNCQTENPASNRFCAHCGRLLDAAASRV